MRNHALIANYWKQWDDLLQAGKNDAMTKESDEGRVTEGRQVTKRIVSREESMPRAVMFEHGAYAPWHP
ncbi:MAG: hypothetical protein LZF62_410026 [Nitrospira sp.]|nr:MAG: hypothetical protein LZF62_410026 [Nitrospira sp.]